MNAFWKISTVVLAMICGVLGTILVLRRDKSPTDVRLVQSSVVQTNVIRFDTAAARELKPSEYWAQFTGGSLSMQSGKFCLLGKIYNQSGQRWESVTVNYNVIERGSIIASKTEYAKGIEHGKLWQFQANRDYIGVSGEITSILVRFPQPL